MTRRHQSKIWICRTPSGPAKEEFTMGKEQRNEKMSKKPKKDTSAPKQSVPSDRPTPPVTSVIPRGKEKNKLR
jgi:hypothetical protein